jgi:hemolysin activation/secretion protein
MHDVKKNTGARPGRMTIMCLAILGMGMQGWAMAQTPAPAAAAPAAAPAPASIQADKSRQVDISEYIVRGNTVLDQRTIEQTVTPFLGPKRTLKDVEDARDALLAAYNAKGYQSVYVDLPEQQVSGGVVFLVVNETKIGRVRVIGAQYNSPTEVRDQVPALKEGSVPDFTQAQVELTALNRSAKRQVMPLVKQGELPGTMDVDLKVDDSTPWHGSAGLTNDYSPDTSHLRATATIANDNLFQMGHSASLTFFGTPQDLGETRVWSGSYTAPLRGTNWSLEADAYVSNSNVATVGGTNVLGKGHSIGLKATYTLPNTGVWWHTLYAGIDFKDNEQALSLNGAGDSVPLKYAPVTLGYSGFLQNERSSFGLNMSIVSGTRSILGYGDNQAVFDDNRLDAVPSFLVWKADTNGTYNFENNMQAAYRLSGQLTDSPLVSGEQIAGGGLTSVRGYMSAEATGDFGLVGSLELRSKPLDYLKAYNVDNWRAYTFVDAGRLGIRDPQVEQDHTFSLASVGVGTSFNVTEHTNGLLDLGYTLLAGPRTGRHDLMLNFSLNASY